MKTYKIVVEVTADEADRLLNTEDVRLAIAGVIRDDFTSEGALLGYDEVSALVSRIRIDGREYDLHTATLEETPINADIANLIAEGKTILAIRELRAANEGMSLMEAKTLVDNWRARR